MPADAPQTGTVGWAVKDWLIQGCSCMLEVLRVEMLPFQVQALSERSPATSNALLRSLVVGDFPLNQEKK